MVRIFRHYLSAKLIAIVALEALVFVLAIRLGLAFEFAGAHGHEVEAAVMPTAMFALAMLVVMNAVGLYSANQWTDLHSVGMRLVAAALLILGLIFLATHL